VTHNWVQQFYRLRARVGYLLNFSFLIRNIVSYKCCPNIFTGFGSIIKENRETAEAKTSISTAVPAAAVIKQSKQTDGNATAQSVGDALMRPAGKLRFIIGFNIVSSKFYPEMITGFGFITGENSERLETKTTLPYGQKVGKETLYQKMQRSACRTYTLTNRWKMKN